MERTLCPWTPVKSVRKLWSTFGTPSLRQIGSGFDTSSQTTESSVTIDSTVHSIISNHVIMVRIEVDFMEHWAGIHPGWDTSPSGGNLG